MPIFPFGFPAAFGEPVMPPLTPTAGQTSELITRQAVTIRTASGVQVHQELPSNQIGLTWSRESREVSICNLVIPSRVLTDGLPRITPWLHWLDVWDDAGHTLHWSGPIQQVSTNRSQVSIAARDPGEYFKKTRCPLTKRWDSADPAAIAAEMIASMVEHHGLNLKARVRQDPLGDKFAYEAKQDTVMLDAVFDELVSRMGLHWTFIAGVPLLGPQPRKSVASLGEEDFVGEGLTVTRDGSTSANDIVLRAADTISRATVPMGGLFLQTIVNADSMFSVSNADRATRQYAKYVSAIRDTVTLPDGVVLHPNAPVSLEQLVPSARFVIDAFGLLVPMELTKVAVNPSNPQAVAVTMAAVDDELPELVDIQQQGTGAGLGR